MAVGDVRARRARQLFGAVVLAGLAAAGIVSTVGAEPSPPRPLVEAPGCGQVTETVAVPSPTYDGEDATAPVVFINPPTTFIWVDGAGLARKVTTNTGCAPRPDDRFLAQPMGDPHRDTAASPSLVSRVMTQEFTGDWRTLGQWHEL